MIRSFLGAAALIPALASVAAADAAEARALVDALGLPDVIEIMAIEGRDYGEDLEAEMFPGRGGEAWEGMVAALYDEGEMGRVVEATFVELMEDVETAPLLEFFRSDTGAEIVALEVEARRALLDEGVEEAAEARLAELRAAEDPRIDRLDAFVEANDLVEQNVVGALNANFAFYTGLMDGGAFDGAMTEDEALRDVWAQEPEIRADTTEWLYSYLALAYEPLDDAAIEAYAELSGTEAGQALNRALFAAFDRAYTGISRGLGEGAARFMVGEDI